MIQFKCKLVPMIRDFKEVLLIRLAFFSKLYSRERLLKHLDIRLVGVASIMTARRCPKHFLNDSESG